MKRLLIILFTLIISISINAQNTVKQNELQSTVLNRLSASSTQAKQFEIAQVMYNSHHWQNGSVIEVELYNVRYASGYEKYIIELGYYQGAQNTSPKITHVDSKGISHNARITLGTPEETTISYGGYINKTISILLDVRHYSSYVTKITHLRSRVSTFTAHQQIIINENPTGVNIADFTPVSFLTNETVRSDGSASYPSQTSRGDAFQVYQNVNNSLEFGLAGGSNTRRSWILSRHSDLSGTYGKYYNTLHLQPDTGDKSQYRGIAIGYGANTHIPVGTHLAVNGHVGIGTTSTNNGILTINGDSYNTLRLENDVPNKEASIRFRSKSSSGGTLHSDIALYATGNGQGYLGFKVPYNNTVNSGYDMVINHLGEVGIGTTDTQGHKLAVAGTIVSEKVKVALQANWPDYVFSKKYSLPNLTDVENHIKEKGHLKNIPSATEVEKNGFFLGEMDSKLLEKIEELTLYTIAQEKEIELLKASSKEVSVLKKQNNLLIKQLNNLSQRLTKIESSK